MEQLMRLVYDMRRCPGRAFSMTELLVAMSIAVLLMSAAVPSVVTLLESNELVRSGQTVVDQIRVARQIASSRNLPVEVRLIKTTSTDPGYTAVQLWTSQLSGTNAVSRLTPLSKAMAISENPAVSDMLSGLSTQTMSTPLNSKASYVAFTVRPSGQVSPTLSMSGLCLTVVSSHYAKKTDSLPLNYVIVQINPSTGSSLVYRP